MLLQKSQNATSLRGVVYQIVTLQKRPLWPTAFSLFLQKQTIAHVLCSLAIYLYNNMIFIDQLYVQKSIFVR